MIRPLSYRSSGDVFFLLYLPAAPCKNGNFWQEWQEFGNRSELSGRMESAPPGRGREGRKEEAIVLRD